MKVLKIIFIDIPLWIWQLPQHIVAMFFFIFNWKKIKKANDCGITYYKAKHVYNCGISLGNYIFLDSDSYKNYENFRDKETIKHEYGHSIQSKILGPLYVFFIGLPSLIGNIVYRIKDKIHEKTDTYETYKQRSLNYYKQPWEYWADSLGKVDREKRKREL